MAKITDKKPASSVKEAHATIRAALSSLRVQVTQKKQEIAAFNAEAQVLLKAPVSFDDYMDFMKADVVSRGLKWKGSSNLLGIRSHETPPNKTSFVDLQNATEADALNTFPEFHDPAYRTSGGAFGALCFFFPDVVAQRLADTYRAAVEARWGNGEFPTVAQRKERLAELDALGKAGEQALSELEADLSELEDGLSPAHFGAHSESASTGEDLDAGGEPAAFPRAGTVSSR